MRSCGGAGDVQPPVETGDDCTGLDVPEVGQVLAVQPLQEQREPPRVRPQQPHGAVAVPVLEREVLVLRLAVRPPDLEHRSLSVGGAHRQHHGGLPVRGGPVGGQLPLPQQVAHQGRQPVEEGGPRRPAGGVRLEGLGE